MANYCCMCGKKLGFMQESCILSDDCKDEVVCQDCKDILFNLRIPKSSQELMNAIQVVTPLLYDPNIKEKVKTVLERDINQANEKIDATRKRDEEEEKRAEKINMFAQNKLMTTGYNFEGYEIVEYCGVVSGEVVLGTGFLSEFSASVADLFGSASSSFSQKMVQAKTIAKNQLMKQAIASGGNALIGVDFDYLTFGNNMIGVSANGTAVVVKKIEE